MIATWIAAGSVGLVLGLICAQLVQIHRILMQLTLATDRRETAMAADLTELTAAVAAIDGVVPSAVAAFQALAAKIDALGQQPTVDPAQLTALAADLNGQAQALGTAIAATSGKV